MEFDLEGMRVYFPFKAVYKEQQEYMLGLKHVLDNGGKGIIEMPTGTGKTVSLLSLIVSYQLAFPGRYKQLVYCTRTFAELEKTLDELKLVVEYIDKSMTEEESNRIANENARLAKEIEELKLAEVGPDLDEVPKRKGRKRPVFKSQKARLLNKRQILAIGVSARRSLCIHPSVSQNTQREIVDAECYRLTAPWNRVANSNNPDALCGYFEQLEELGESGLANLTGVYNLDDLKTHGRKNKVCPYYLARKAVGEANIVVCNYPYLVDSGVSDVVRGKTDNASIVVFDEAHNIDNICIDALTVKLNKGMLESASIQLDRVKDKAAAAGEAVVTKLREEYQEMVSQLKTEEAKKVATMKGQPEFSEAMPGSIRKAEHFMGLLKRILVFLKGFLKIKDVRVMTSTEFLDELTGKGAIDAQVLPFVQERFRRLINSLEITELDQLATLTTITEFTSLLSGYSAGFKVILEPYQEQSSAPDPLLQFCCLDPSLALRPVMEKYKAVVLTSGTMSPLQIYPKMLGFEATLLKSVKAFLPRNSIAPMVIARGSDQIPMTSEFSERGNLMVVRNYGKLIVELAKVVPDGVIVFFPSYGYMKDLLVDWNQKGILEEILKYKLLFVETKDIVQTATAMSHFRDACRSGRGAVFLSVARGKVSEGVDFKNYLGRCVVIIGVPFQYSKSKPLLCRMEYAEKTHGISNKDFLTFDAMRQTSQCLGRVIRSKPDYGLMILADRRFSKEDKLEKLPDWIKSNMDVGSRDLQLDVAIARAKQFFRQMGQPLVLTDDVYYMQAPKTQQEEEAMQAEKKAKH